MKLFDGETILIKILFSYLLVRKILDVRVITCGCKCVDGVKGKRREESRTGEKRIGETGEDR